MELAVELAGYDPAALLRLGLQVTKLQAQLPRIAAGDVSVWRAAELAGVSLRQMLGYAAGQGAGLGYDADTLAEEQARW